MTPIGGNLVGPVQGPDGRWHALWRDKDGHWLAFGDPAWGRPLALIRPSWWKKSHKLPPKLRSAVIDRDGPACVLCGSAEMIEVDHIMPRARGGGDEMENLRVLCRSCNRRKSAKHPDEWEG